MTSHDLEIKTARIVELLEREHLGGVLLNAQHNFAWLTSGGSNGIDLSRENGAASLLVTSTGKRFVLANNIETPRMLAEELSSKDFEPVAFAWQAEKANGDLPLELCRQIVPNGEIATDIPLFSNVPAIEGKLAQCRHQLTELEIGRYRELGRDAGAVMMRVIETLKPGESELSVAAKMRAELAAANITSVVTLVAADDRIAQFRHPVPTEKIWNKTLLMVTCAKRFGLIASLSRIICVGEVPDELRRRTETTACVNAAIYDATRPGAIGSEIYAVAARAYEEQGFADEIGLHHQGGAAGYKTREWVAHPQSSEIVKQDQALAWNPSITGSKVEETFILRSDVPEVITTSPGFPQIETSIGGRQYLSPGVLSI